MKKYFRVPIITVLVFIVIIFGAYTLINFKTSLLGLFLNVYLKKHGIYQHFKSLEVRSSSSVSINGFVLKKKDISFSADSLKLKIDKMGKVSLTLDNPVIVIVLKKTKGGSKGFSIPPLKIGLVKAKGLTLKVMKDGKEVVDIGRANLKLTGSTLSFNGKVQFNNGNVLLDGDIDNLTCSYTVSKNGISLDDIKLLPKRLYAHFNGLKFQTDKSISISNITIRFSPFSVSIGNLNGDFISQYRNIRISFGTRVNYKDNKASVVLKGVRLIGEPLSVGVIRAKVSLGRRPVVSAQFDNLTSNLNAFVSQDIKGRLTYGGVARLSVSAGQAIVLNNLFFDFSYDPLKALFDPKKMKAEVALGNLFKSEVERGLDGYKISLYTDNLTGITQFLSDSLDIQAFKDVHIQGTQIADVQGILNTKAKSIVALVHLICSKILYKNVKLSNVNALFPFVLSSSIEKKGNINIGKLAFNGYSFPLHADLESSNGKVLAHFWAIKTLKLNISPFNLSFNLNKKTFYFSKIRALILTKLSKTFIDLSGKYASDTLKTKGAVTIKVFDGLVKVKNISLKLKDVPIISMNITFDHLNLKKITQNTSFGLITGFIKGYVKDLSLVNFKYPLSFEARVETEEVKGVSKRISLKAVNSIASVGGGIASVAVPFFKTFPYSKIGFIAILKNGRFQIHGLYRDKNDEYIIKKGFLIGIDVVNMNRDNSIAWDDFVNRIKRVLRGGDK